MLSVPPADPIPEGILRIGDVSALTGLSLRSIRHYEDLGLVVPTSRTPGGFREYDAEAVERLRLVMQLRLAGLGLDDIAPVVEACRRAELGEGGDDLPDIEQSLHIVDEAVEDLERRLAVTREVQRRISVARGS